MHRQIVFLSCLLLSPMVARADIHAEQRRAYEQYALTHAGDPEMGKRVFDDEKKSKCLSCHKVEQKGGIVGPDLSGIGGKFDRPHLIESLLEPSRQIVEGYRASTVLTVDGRALTGIVKQQDDHQIVLEDSDGKRFELLRDEIQAIKSSDVSLMPEGLATTLTKDEFTDLVAYLEVRRAGFDDAFGGGIQGPIQVPEDWQIETVATGLSGATAMQVLADGRLLICEQPGDLRVIKDGKLLEDPMLSVDVELNWERGLIGVTAHPDFPHQPWVYVCYVAAEPFTHHRISRFRVDGDTAVAGSEQILLRGDDQSKLGGHVPAGHQGGAMHFGSDGKLYIGLGEQTAGSPAQSLQTLQGKILRINDDGTIPSDNPFIDQTDGKYQAIWAIGCRNPFTFAVDGSTGRLLINDVGGKFEEINPGVAGANYGWPTLDHGFTDKQGFVGPIHVYPESSISGGDFMPGGKAGEKTYYFADFVQGWIHRIDPDLATEAENFVSGLRRPVDLRFASDGSLYVLLRNAWIVDGKFQRGTGSLLRVHRSTGRESK